MERENLYSFVSLITDPNEANRMFLTRNCILNNLEPTFCMQETSNGFHCTLILAGVLFATTSVEHSSKAKAKREVIDIAVDKLKKHYLKIELLQKNKLNAVEVEKDLTVDIICEEMQNFAQNPTLDMISFEITKEEYRQTLQDLAFRYGFQSYASLASPIVGQKRLVHVFRPKRDPQQIYLYLMNHNDSDFYRICNAAPMGQEQQ